MSEIKNAELVIIPSPGMGHLVPALGKFQQGSSDGNCAGSKGQRVPVLVVSKEVATKRLMVSKRVREPGRCIAGGVLAKNKRDWNGDRMGTPSRNFVSSCRGWICVALWLEFNFGEYLVRCANGNMPNGKGFQLVKDLCMAVDIKIKGSNTDVIKAEEIEKAIRHLMDPENGIRLKVKDMKENSILALKEGGSSYNSVGSFIEQVTANN
ncbi:hypothetical protein MTR67_031992 [Solanum verrucosum]|uniref:Uncharacterized protein n=1 Tax=Solanum verrucosum TaxID=315347 RepID=A0AAF0U3L1_SOLVR|nr:hypothetical protein MTR67_031992 [Solanum verrucosum]